MGRGDWKFPLTRCRRKTWKETKWVAEGRRSLKALWGLVWAPRKCSWHLARLWETPRENQATEKSRLRFKSELYSKLSNNSVCATLLRRCLRDRARRKGCVCSVLPNSLETPWTVSLQDPPSMEFSRQEYRRGLPFLSPGHLPDPEMELRRLCVLRCQAGPSPAERVSGINTHTDFFQ